MGDVGSKCIGEHPDGHTTPQEQYRLGETQCIYKTIEILETNIALQMAFRAKVLPANMPTVLILKILYYALDVELDHIPITKCVPIGYEAAEEGIDNNEVSTDGTQQEEESEFDMVKEDKLLTTPVPLLSGACECLSFATEDFGEQYLVDQGMSSKSKRHLSVCAVCFGIVRCTISPTLKFLQQSGQHHFILERNNMNNNHQLHEEGRYMTWRKCRHFEQMTDTLSSSVVIRHRSSNFHSFRTIVASEWILSGQVKYDLTFFTGNMQSPIHAFAIGVVLPETTVNLTTSWAPGTADKSYGFVVEDITDEDMTEANLSNQQFVINRQNETRMVCSKGFQFSVDSTNNCIAEKKGMQLFHQMTVAHAEPFGVSVIINYDDELLIIQTKQQQCTKQNSTFRKLPEMITLTIPLINLHQRPVALAVGLKYAHDCVEFTSEGSPLQ
jgi:hypothetical protein